MIKKIKEILLNMKIANWLNDRISNKFILNDSDCAWVALSEIKNIRLGGWTRTNVKRKKTTKCHGLVLSTDAEGNNTVCFIAMPKWMSKETKEVIKKMVAERVL